MTKSLLMIISHKDSAWAHLLNETLQTISLVHIIEEQYVLEKINAHIYKLAVVDATTISGDVAVFVAHLHRESPNTPIIVATNSPTWRRAQQIFRAGAIDYIQKSFNKKEILTNFKKIILEPPLHQSLAGEEGNDKTNNFTS